MLDNVDQVSTSNNKIFCDHFHCDLEQIAFDY